ncbi:Dehydrogenase/reductase SDR family member 2, mitochondrial [Plecturocebus cupreus]
MSPVAPVCMRSTSSGANYRLKLANKASMITGSTNGIGFTIAQRLAQNRAHVVISSRKGRAECVPGTVCPVEKTEDWEWLVVMAQPQGHETSPTAADNFFFSNPSPFLTLRPWNTEGVDFLVCIAGVSPLVGSTLGSSEEVWDKVRSGEASRGQAGLHPHLPAM